MRPVIILFITFFCFLALLFPTMGNTLTHEEITGIIKWFYGYVNITADANWEDLDQYTTKMLSEVYNCSEAMSFVAIIFDSAIYPPTSISFLFIKFGLNLIKNQGKIYESCKNRVAINFKSVIVCAANGL